jgi:hypothetical protein
MQRVDTSFSVTVTSHTLKEVFTLFMTGYSYTKRSVHSSWLVSITLKEVSALFMAGYNTSFSVTVTSHEESKHCF